MSGSGDGQTGTAQGRGSAALHLKLRDGLVISVQPSLSAITTYVLLEQEEWFEKEIDFVRAFLKPGMVALDIGANLGLYSLRMAQRVGPGGRVSAYEPGSSARALLEASRTLNGFANLEVVAAAVSDGEREGRLSFAATTELRTLSGGGPGERIRITSIDAEYALRRWPSVDFVKIDAEGEEERIVAGGRALLTAQSPLVMFEVVVAKADASKRVAARLSDLGFAIYRQLGGAPILVPFDIAQRFEAFELNLFAAKPDRAASLARQGLVVESIADWTPGAAEHAQAASFWRSQKFARAVGGSATGDLSADADYRDALAGYATWRNAAEGASIRCAALAFALQRLYAACARAHTPERASMLARVAWEWGARGEAVAVLRKLLTNYKAGRVASGEPFWPAHPRFDDIDPGGRTPNWLAEAAAEQFERCAHYSTLYNGASPYLSWACDQPNAGTEMLRRRTLIEARAGRRPIVPERLCVAAPDHLNAEIWRAGLVPGTVVRSG